MIFLLKGPSHFIVSMVIDYLALLKLAYFHRVFAQQLGYLPEQSLFITCSIGINVNAVLNCLFRMFR